MGRFGLMPVIAALLLFAAPAMAEEKLNCHSYDAADPNPNVQREFGALFRKGYEVVVVHGDRSGPMAYRVGYRPKKGKAGICTYVERDVSRVDIDGKISWRNAPSGQDQSLPPSEWHMVSMPDGNCPPFGDESYVDGGGAPEEVLAAILTFWKGLNVGTVERMFAGIREPNGAKREMIATYKRRAGPGEIHLARIIDASSAGGGKRHDAGDPPFGFAIWTTGRDKGWLVGGNVVDGRFVPSAVLPWIE